MSASEFLSIYATERISMAGPLTVTELHVHLGKPGPVVDVGDHELQYTRIEFHGKGAFTMLRHGKQLWRYEQ
jgi:hypothetical protein